MKTLVAYFSATGVTKAVAETITAIMNADIFEISPPVLYSKSDLDWTNKESRSSIEMNDAACRPEFVGNAEISEYDTVFIGFPIWWYVEPRIIDTFLEKYDFSGKTLVPFATSGSSGFDKTDESLKKICPAANLKPGKILNGKPSAEIIKNWVTSLGL
jgi:flavodoxin